MFRALRVEGFWGWGVLGVVGFRGLGGLGFRVWGSGLRVEGLELRGFKLWFPKVLVVEVL